MQDHTAVKAFFRFMHDWKPDLRVFGGDLMDLRSLRKRANEDEKRSSILLDVQMSTEFLYQYKPHVFLRGNHDERLYDIAAQNQGPWSDLASQCIVAFEKDLAKVGCKVHLPYDKRNGIYVLGHLKMAHGYCLGVGAAREMARTYGTVMFGHNHTPQRVAIEGIETRIGWGSGCLCDLNMTFQRASLRSLAHNHGWIQGVTNVKTGEFQAWSVENVNGSFRAVEGFKEY